MAAENRSTLEFKSNIYPVTKEEIIHDQDFLGVLRDARAIQLFNRKATRVFPTALQKQILRDVGVSCALFDGDDLTWGTVLVDGEEKVVCKCENFICERITDCRADLSEEQISILADALVRKKKHDEKQRKSLEKAGTQVQASQMAQPTIPQKEGDDKANLKQRKAKAPEPQEATPAVKEYAGGQPATSPTLKAMLQEQGLLDAVKFEKTREQESHAAEEPAVVRGENKPAVEKTEESSELKQPEAGEHARPVCEQHHSGYDEDQARIIEADPSERIYVNAGAGTGKTHTLIEKLKYMIENQEVNPEEITVLSFTCAAVEVIQNRLKAAAMRGEVTAPWQDIDVTTIDKLATRILFACLEDPSDTAARKKISALDYDARIVAAKNRINAKPELLEDCAHFIVDETQDLVGSRADFILALLSGLPGDCGFTILGDRCQSIFDYQAENDPTATTSIEFYKSVARKFRPVEVYLEKNYRQRPEYPLDLSEMRSHLLSEDADGALDDLERYEGILGKPKSRLELIDDAVVERQINRHIAKGSMGVLTWRNADALALESFLWKRGISSIQSRSDANCKPTRCIADALWLCGAETLDRGTFEELTARTDPYDDGRMWSAILALKDLRADGGRVKIERMLSALQGAVLPPALEAVRQKGNAVTVSTIHKAKGREFSTVWLLSEDLAAFEKEGTLSAAKISYVGLSRAVSDIELVSLHGAGSSGGYSKKMFNTDRYFRKRTAKGLRNRKSKVNNIEIRNERDVDFSSFGADAAIQALLRGGDIEGKELRLVLRGSGERSYYAIVLEQDENVCFGKLNRIFIDDYRACSGKAGGSLPDAFDNVFIDRVVTCVGRAAAAPEHAKAFGNMAVWYGMTIGGFAHRDDTQHY